MDFYKMTVDEICEHRREVTKKEFEQRLKYIEKKKFKPGLVIYKNARGCSGSNDGPSCIQATIVEVLDTGHIFCKRGSESTRRIETLNPIGWYEKDEYIRREWEKEEKKVNKFIKSIRRDMDNLKSNK